jgi:BON domain
VSTRKMVDLARRTAPRGIPVRLVVKRSRRGTMVAMLSGGVGNVLAQRMRTGHARRQGAMLGLVSGAIGAYLLDPKLGRSRRAQLAAQVRRERRQLLHAGRVRALRSVGQAKGVVHKLHPGEPEPLDDAGLAHRVESVLFRYPEIPKGAISINAESGKVFLRGQVETEAQIAHAAGVTGLVPGVVEVVNLLHLPGTEAPHVQPEKDVNVG